MIETNPKDLDLQWTFGFVLFSGLEPQNNLKIRVQTTRLGSGQTGRVFDSILKKYRNQKSKIFYWKGAAIFMLMRRASANRQGIIALFLPLDQIVISKAAREVSVQFGWSFGAF